MSDFGKPITSQELANLTATSERYIREWLANQAADGYLTASEKIMVGSL
jgi:DNA-binding GntR family transcriptional regulator